MSEHEAFYVPIDKDSFESTGATTSPWDESLQHGGPPAALLARAVESVRPDPAMPIARITIDILGGIVQGRIRTEAIVVRPGKRIELVEARLFAEDRLAVTATAWRMRADTGSTQRFTTTTDLPAVPEERPQPYFSGVSPDWGYGRAIDWRFVEGAYDALGPASVWTRPRIPLVAGETTSPTQRLLVVADSTNGLSAEVPFSGWLFIPPTMTATIQRTPRGEWLFLSAATTIGPDGIGLAAGTAFDQDGFVASIAQPLLVTPR